MMRSRLAGKRAGVTSIRRKEPKDEPKRFRLILYLTPAAKNSLRRLQLKSWDKQGKRPPESQIIETLIHSALENKPEVFYPKRSARKPT